MKIYLATFLMALALPFYSFAFQGENTNIKLLDAQSGKPINGATFSYGTQKGISSEDGIISFHYQEETSMSLSHISYGKWTLEAVTIKEAINTGVYKKEPRIFQTLPVTVIALHASADQKQSLAIDYQDKAAHDAAALLNQLPAFNSIRKSGNYGFDPVFRGFKYDQLNIVIDGCQTASAACPNRMDPPISQVSPNMMEGIDIYKGPHSLRFGNALGGTINFKTNLPSFSTQPRGYGRVSGSYESNGDIFRTEAMAGARNKVIDLSLFGAFAKGNDYQDGNGEAVPANFMRNSFGANLGVKLTPNQTLTFSATKNKAKDVEFPALPMDLRSDDTWLFNTSHQINFSDRKLSTWKTSVYETIVDHLMDNFDKNLDPRMVDASTSAKTKNYGGRTEGTWHFDNGSLYAGADARIESADGKRERSFLMGPNKGKTVQDNAWQNSQIKRMSGFAEYHFGKGNTQFVFSGRLEYNNAKATDIQSKFEGANEINATNQVNPSLSLGAIYDLGKGFSVGTWLARAQRSGSIAERYINFFPVGNDPYEMLGNPDILPEVNNQLDISFGYKNTDTQIKLDLFASYLQDFISSSIDTTLSPLLPTSPGVRRFINLSEAFKTGFEISWSQHLIGAFQQQLSFAYTYAQDLSRDEPLPEIAPMDIRYVLFANFLEGKLVPELSYRYVMAQNRISEEYGETVTPAFNLLDAKINYQFSKSIQATAGVQNLFDKTYYEHLNRSVRGTPNAIYAPGRSFFVSVSVDLR
ncbi:TonB-dependent receptor [Flammeovirgaceae bacterium SG7u.111]|nr:TonB-dependent receptor [Flammeovirgaceae bacterium SG7u.132]WPO38055.1 TonB-dependent receptor [Flammeovirgaceae bacterium SG7u.111]